MADIFLSYRRSDTGWATGRIADRLEAEFGPGAVFMDTLTIGLGENVNDVIGERLESCRVFLPVIGDTWLDEIFNRRNHGNDFVRVEISEALKRGVRIVPVFIDDAHVPNPSDMPEDLAGLTQRNGLRLKADTFANDIQPLLGFLEGALSDQAAPAAEGAGAPAPAKTELCLQPRTEYWKQGSDGRPRYRIFVRLGGPAEMLDRVEKVVYRLHKTFRNPVREIMDRASNFELKTNGWGGFDLIGDVYFKDGAAAPIRLETWVGMAG